MQNRIQILSKNQLLIAIQKLAAGALLDVLLADLLDESALENIP
jgi:hypothetical protein